MWFLCVFSFLVVLGIWGYKATDLFVFRRSTAWLVSSGHLGACLLFSGFYLPSTPQWILDSLFGGLPPRTVFQWVYIVKELRNRLQWTIEIEFYTAAYKSTRLCLCGMWPIQKVNTTHELSFSRPPGHWHCQQACNARGSCASTTTTKHFGLSPLCTKIFSKYSHPNKCETDGEFT